MKLFSKNKKDKLIVSIVSKDEKKNISSLRSQIVGYALQFEGNPFAYGGCSLTKGADCSGFVQAVFKSQGINLPRTSKQQAIGGKNIPLSDIKPGDLIFYNKNGEINHVAIYIGNKKIIHASNPKSGIKISKYNYRKPFKAVSYLD